MNETNSNSSTPTASAPRGFGSDNHAPVHPRILQNLSLCNVGHAPSYGTDEWTQKAIQEFQKQFGAKAEVFFVFNGTAANVLALRAGLKRFETVLCSDHAHLHHDECGAPEFFAGKLQLIKSTDGKISAQDIEESLIRRGDQHYSQAQMVSITQPTEVGTCYSLDEIKAISDVCKKHGLILHVDGARLANSVSFLNTNFEELFTKTGADLVSFGGTKNGLMFGEAVVILNSQLARGFNYIRKQSAQLPSKSRYIAAQFLAYFQDDLYLQIARHGHQMAKLLERGLQELQRQHPEKGPRVVYPVQSNAVFAKIQKEHLKPLRNHSFFYVWDEKTHVCRLMCSWDTQATDIESFLLAYSKLLV